MADTKIKERTKAKRALTNAIKQNNALLEEGGTKHIAKHFFETEVKNKYEILLIKHEDVIDLESDDEDPNYLDSSNKSYMALMLSLDTSSEQAKFDLQRAASRVQKDNDTLKELLHSSQLLENREMLELEFKTTQFKAKIGGLNSIIDNNSTLLSQLDLSSSTKLLDLAEETMEGLLMRLHIYKSSQDKAHITVTNDPLISVDSARSTQIAAAHSTSDQHVAATLSPQGEVTTGQTEVTAGRSPDGAVHVDNTRLPNVSRSDIFRTKKPELPTFSGTRHDWPEFRKLWRELAELQFTNKIQLAHELKRNCGKGRAKQLLSNVFISSPDAYEEMWERLDEEYNDPGLCVQYALDRLSTIKKVDQHDYSGLVSLVDQVESVHNMLRELGLLDAIHMTDVDRISFNLPQHIHNDWIRKYRDMDGATKQRPFPAFVAFMRKERLAASRLSEAYTKPHKVGESSSAKRTSSHVATVPSADCKEECVVHKTPQHKTSVCKHFKGMSTSERWEAVKKHRACFKCFKSHARQSCKAPSCRCGKDHHILLCSKEPISKPLSHATDTTGVKEVSSETGTVRAGTMALYPIHKVHVSGSNQPIVCFMDSGSDASYITEKCARRNGFKKVRDNQLTIRMVGGTSKNQKSATYEVPLVTLEGKVVKVHAYCLKKITNPIAPISLEAIEELFPEFDVRHLTRSTNDVELMLGTDYFGLHPRQQIAEAGENLFIMKGVLGTCLVGTHPLLKDTCGQTASGNQLLRTHCVRSLAESVRSDTFFEGEELGTECQPKCGGCKCGRCPLLGHTLSFKEEQELEMIRANLLYDHDSLSWTTSYPWLVDPLQLPNNYGAALATLQSTERGLLRDPAWAQSYTDQMTDMLDRGVARKLSKQDINGWEGPLFYISHLAVKNPKSNSTPVRIVFNSSQSYKGTSLNNCLAKGPDSFRNSIIGLLLRWREEPIAIVGDIQKMFHSVYLHPLEQHCHRFLWRDLDQHRDPDVYVMERVNMGDRPAPAIATEALFMTADLHGESLPEAARFIKHSSYVDDLIDSVETIEIATQLKSQTEQLLRLGNFHVKCWQVTGEMPAENTVHQHLLKGDAEKTSVLGVGWHPIEDTVSYNASLNFSKRKRGCKTEPDLEKQDLEKCIPLDLTKRQVLQQVMSIFDPLGLISPFTLLGKLYLRESWLLKHDWDEAFPQHLRQKWLWFFKHLFEIEELQYKRCVKPQNAVGNPWLILLSDGSDCAYGCAAYVRWECDDGSYHTRLFMAKSRIAPINKVSTPRMELNGAVVSKRCRATLENNCRYTFDRVLHLVDSETVLNMVNKTSTRFGVYEGVRIGEIQAYTNGNMHDWAWIEGQTNTADWLTRGRTPAELSENSEWINGPPMFRKPFDQWNIKFGKTSDDLLPGEKKIVTAHVAEADSDTLFECNRVSTFSKLLRVAARVMNIAKNKSFACGREGLVTPISLKSAEVFLIKMAQKDVDIGGPSYKRLNPTQTDDGIWVVGATRLVNHNPLAAIHASLPAFMPHKHPLTLLAMKAHHTRGHRGRDSTLASFREKFWTPHGPKLAKAVKNACYLCRLRDAKLLEQKMGNLPSDRLKPSPPFNHTMVDLFGPYSIRGEVQKRTSGKAWGVIFTDLCARAVHIEAVFGYDTSHFLLALSRFVSLRGWPERMYSDPGTQLLGANTEMNESAKRLGADHGMEWIVGPADSPWHQGAVEALVKSAKRALKLAIHTQRLSAPEFLTVCTEAANTINERPIGLLPSLDSDINVLTPNCLLLGRATSVNPNCWQPGSTSLKTRFHLVNAVGEQFWKHWIELFAPNLLYQEKWHKARRNLQVDDVVLVADSNAIRGEYRLARVTETHPGRDGSVRKVTITYKNFKTGKDVRSYSGAKNTTVTRSVQRLAILVPVEDQPQV